MPHGPVAPVALEPVMHWIDPTQPGYSSWNHLEFYFWDMQSDGKPDSYTGGHMFKGTAVLTGEGLIGQAFGMPYLKEFGGNPWNWKADLHFTVKASDPISLSYTVDITATDGNRQHRRDNLTDFYLEDRLDESYVQLDFGDGSGTAIAFYMDRVPPWLSLVTQRVRDVVLPVEIGG